MILKGVLKGKALACPRDSFVGRILGWRFQELCLPPGTPDAALREGI